MRDRARKCAGLAIAALMMTAHPLAMAQNDKTAAATTMNQGRAQRVPVVVELFTSEGCSDCPPADKLLADLQRLQPVEGREVIALGFHVDYWDHQGWRDRFSSHAYTERQQEYARKLQVESPYTPQMVVQGTKEFVGSRGRKAVDEIGGAAPAQRLEIVKAPDGGYRVPWTGGGHLFVAMVEDGLETKVGAGENGGKVLHHAAVVRQMRELKRGEEFKVKQGGDWNVANLRVVAWVEDGRGVKAAGEAAY